jgi:hypothetical protein
LAFAAAIVVPAFGTDAMVTLKWVDEDGKPLSEIPVTAGFEGDVTQQAKTDTNGLCVVTGTTYCGEVTYCAQPENFYYSQGRYKFAGGIKDGKNQPWNPMVTTVVRRVINPIPMYSMKISRKIPIENAPIGFDLERADWVQPYGAGMRSDFIFNVSRRVTSLDDFVGSVSLTFTNLLDGVQKINDGLFPHSYLILPRYAFSTGYITNYLYSTGKDPARGRYGAKSDDPKEYYFFRIRSVSDEKGNLKECLYGALIGRIEYSGIASSNNFTVSFLYYLNPTPNDRNMEFDPKRNLIPNLKPTEQIKVP